VTMDVVTCIHLYTALTQLEEIELSATHHNIDITCGKTRIIWHCKTK